MHTLFFFYKGVQIQQFMKRFFYYKNAYYFKVEKWFSESLRIVKVFIILFVYWNPFDAHMYICLDICLLLLVLFFDDHVVFQTKINIKIR